MKPCKPSSLATYEGYCPKCGHDNQRKVDTLTTCIGCYNTEKAEVFRQKTGAQTVFKRMANIADMIMENYAADFHVHDRNALAELIKLDDTTEFIWAVRSSGTLIDSKSHNDIGGLEYYRDNYNGLALFFHGNLKEGKLEPITVQRAIQIKKGWNKS